MSAVAWGTTYLVACATFLLVDLIWLGAVANGLYSRLLGDLKRDSPNWIAALSFYALFVAGLLWFCIRPAIHEHSASLGTAALNAAIYGLVTYATWDLTNAAVLRGFPSAVVPIDMAWGVVLSTIVATVTTLCVRAWFV